MGLLLLYLNELINIYLGSQFWFIVNIIDKTDINNMSLVSSIIFIYLFLLNNLSVFIDLAILGLSVACGRRQWHPTPVLLPGKSHGQRGLVGCNPWGR